MLSGEGAVTRDENRYMTRNWTTRMIGHQFREKAEDAIYSPLPDLGFLSLAPFMLAM
jgi:hypothetical protein